MASWPKDVGIHAIELVLPPQYVDQSELETYDGVSAGKYTIGLGQQKMGFCTDREDINSLCLTAVRNLIEKAGIAYSDIGRLEVGTETILDKSKSIKTVLMQLFEPHGVDDIEGIDTTNACYGGTAALFNALAWLESSAWNGRYAIVVAGDIAVYAKGAARPTGGAGAVALLLGPDAPLVFDRGVRSTYVAHAYDFYKPDLTSEYPTVDGKLSIQCYLTALDKCYRSYCDKVAAKTGDKIDLDYFDAVLFHSPYCKLVQKSFARLVLNDFVHATEKPKKYAELESFSNVVLEKTYFDRDVEKAFMQFSNKAFKEKTAPSLLVAEQVGNTYTSSLYGSLTSLLVSKDVSQLAGNRIGLFSYGSGLIASFFTIRASDDCGENSKLTKLIRNLAYLKPLLEQRVKISPDKFEATLELKQKNCHKAPYEPTASLEHLKPGTYYLTKIDEVFRRTYERIPVSTNGYK